MIVKVLGISALAFAAASVPIILWYLLKRPPLVRSTKALLFFGIFVLPVGSAATGNVAGFEVSTERRFCGSCHVMTPYTAEARDGEASSLSALHARNHWFGEKSCYTCHADYGMFGTAYTKLNGMIHMAHYYATYRGMNVAEATERIHLYKPYKNDACLQCHSLTLPGFVDIGDHRGQLEEIKSGAVGCASAGCHGPSHPWSKLPGKIGVVP